MPDADDPISQARQGGIWLVGLSGAAIGGALAKLDWLLKLPRDARIAFVVAFVAFLASVYWGSNYVAQLLPLKQLSQKRKDARDRHAPDNELSPINAEITEVEAKSTRFQRIMIGGFFVGGLSLVACVCMSLFSGIDLDPKQPKQPDPTPPNKFLITNVPVHIRGRLDHSHTLLLNQQTGEIWELTCQNGKIIEFHGVPVVPTPK